MRPPCEQHMSYRPPTHTRYTAAKCPGWDVLPYYSCSCTPPHSLCPPPSPFPPARLPYQRLPSVARHMWTLSTRACCAPADVCATKYTLAAQRSTAGGATAGDAPALQPHAWAPSSGPASAPAAPGEEGQGPWGGGGGKCCGPVRVAVFGGGEGVRGGGRGRQEGRGEREGRWVV